MSINPDLKVIIDFGINDAIALGEEEYRVRVPEDFKETLFYDLDNVLNYIKSLGYSATTNAPDEDAWHGWDIPANREHLYPEKLSMGKDHSNYQIMESSPNTLTIDVKLKEK